MPEDSFGQGCGQGAVKPGTAGRQNRVLLAPSPTSGTLVPSRGCIQTSPPGSMPAHPCPHPCPVWGSRPGRLALPVPALCGRDARFTIGFKDRWEGFHLE